MNDAMREVAIATLDRALRIMVTECRGNSGPLDRSLPAVIAGFGVQRGAFVVTDERPLHYRPALDGKLLRSLPELTMIQAAKREMLDEWDDSFSAPMANAAVWIKVRNKWAARLGLPSVSFNDLDDLYATGESGGARGSAA